MADSSGTATQALRISPADARRRLEAGEPATIVDVRGAQAWNSSDVKIRGAVRVEPGHLHIDPSWPRQQLTLVY